MHTDSDKSDNTPEVLLRQAITEDATSGLNEDHSWDEDIIVRLMNYESRARQEQMSSQTLQVILSGRRLLGN